MLAIGKIHATSLQPQGSRKKKVFVFCKEVYIHICQDMSKNTTLCDNSNH